MQEINKSFYVSNLDLSVEKTEKNTNNDPLLIEVNVAL